MCNIEFFEEMCWSIEEELIMKKDEIFLEEKFFLVLIKFCE